MDDIPIASSSPHASEDGDSTNGDEESLEVTSPFIQGRSFSPIEWLSPLNTPRPERADAPPPVDLTVPPSSDGIIPSSPITGTRAERAKKSRSKGQRKRVNTMAKSKQASLTQSSITDRQRRSRILNEALDVLSRNDLTFRELMFYVFDPVNGQGQVKWNGFFKFHGAASSILDHWVSSQNSDTARGEVEKWCVQQVEDRIRKEAEAITESGYLRTSKLSVNSDFITRFDLGAIGEHFSSVASVTTRLLTTFATSSKQEKSISPLRASRKAMVITSSILQLLGEHSMCNNLSRKLMGLYLYATGTERQPISVISHLGISESYTSIVAKERIRKDKKGQGKVTDKDGTQPPMTKAGTLRSLSASMREAARKIAASGTFAVVYDNINIMFRAAEQALGRNDSLENGTCATIWPLWNADIRDMQLSDFDAAYNMARPLSISDILHTPEEASLFRRCLIHTILRVIVTYGGKPFERFKAELDEHQPETDEKIEPHVTEMYPLPAMEIDESSISGNVDVINAIAKELKLEKTDHFDTAVKIFAGDQLSISRLRSAANIRAGHESGFASFGWGVWMPGLFHAKMADTQGTLLAHWGKPDTGVRNPGSLWFHNTITYRHPITLTSLPPFRTCRDIVFLSAYSRVLHCLLLVSDNETLEECAQSVKSWRELYSHAEAIYDRFANARLVHELRRRRATSPAADRDGDMVFENAILFLRDSLVSLEFSHCIKWGDMGRVRQVLKTWCLSFRGNGRTKYAHEMLHVIHGIYNILPQALRRIIVNNCLVNPTGHPDGFIEVDLAQEHYNFWHKNFYIAHGNTSSWDWLGMISPCVSLLRKLVSSFKSSLGSWQGVTHKTPDLSLDIKTLMDSLATHGVYQFRKGRVLDDNDDAVTDVITSGLQQLTNGTSSPLKDYNEAFLRLQQRRQMTSVESQSQETQALSPPEEDPKVTEDTESEASSDEVASESASEDDGLDAGDIALGDEGEAENEDSDLESDSYISMSDSDDSHEL